jgi:DNA-binding PadR family transcriptional regulator
VYRLTDAGRDALFEWLGAPSAPTRLRDDFFMKLTFAKAFGIADPAELIARQRAAYLRSLGDLERVLADGGEDETTSLVVEGAALHLEADLRWLDRCEEVLGL